VLGAGALLTGAVADLLDDVDDVEAVVVVLGAGRAAGSIAAVPAKAVVEDTTGVLVLFVVVDVVDFVFDDEADVDLVVCLAIASASKAALRIAISSPH
jgi:hypothetical protein